MTEEILQEAIKQLRAIAEGVNNPWTVLVSLLGVLVALLLGVIGIFQDRIRSLFRRPKLDIYIKSEPPDCHKTSFRDSNTGRYICDTYYLRFRVENNGNHYAEDAEAMVVGVYKRINDNYEEMKDFLPLNVVWSHYRKITMSKIQPKLFKHLDFGYILKADFVDLEKFGIDRSSNITFQFDVAVIPNTGSHILLPGDYKIKVVFAANNLKPIEKTYHLVIKDAWTDDEETMLRDNILIEEINA